MPNFWSGLVLHELLTQEPCNREALLQARHVCTGPEEGGQAPKDRVYGKDEGDHRSQLRSLSGGGVVLACALQLHDLVAEFLLPLSLMAVCIESTD